MNDTAPVLENEFIKASVYENSPIGTFVTAVRAVGHPNLHFSVVDSEEHSEMFDVDQNTGSFAKSFIAE